jgi:hypothetical protein
MEAEMRSFVHGMEMGIFSALMGAANATSGGTRTHTVRVSNKGTIARLAATLRSEHDRANRLSRENADLRRQLDESRRAVSHLTTKIARH